MYIYSNTSAKLLYVETEAPLGAYRILDKDGNEISCPLLRCTEENGKYTATLDASALENWSVNTPVLYTFQTDTEAVRFGHNQLRTFQNKHILLNDNPIYLRGYIRGIIAHEHPNMTGGSDYEAACKNIRQAKKYGFNLVRFHSKIPSDDFIRAADELGMLIHLETGFKFKWLFNENNRPVKKVVESFGETLWEDTILRLRNHPSIAIFCIGNEMHRAAHYPEVHAMIQKGRALAPTKLIMDNCGWGEFDRDTADLYIQHMGYYLPYDNHEDMFLSDRLWKSDASAYDVPLKLAPREGEGVRVTRHCDPLKPVLAHEAMHYIDIPDYFALEKKFDEFCEKVGPEYLEKHGIKKPKYFDGLRRFIDRQKLWEDLPDYIAASRKMKLICTKLYLERLRLSRKLCGYEMLQFSDCLKYENKNGIVDFFDDDKGIDAGWMLEMNDDLVLLAEFTQERQYEDEDLTVDIFASDFLPEARVNGTLQLQLDGETLFTGDHFALTGGLQHLFTLSTKVKTSGKPQAHTLSARFVSGDLTVTNSWKFWTYPRVRPQGIPQMQLENTALENYLRSGSKESPLYVTDTFDASVFEKLESGKTVVLLYEYLAERNTWNMPGAVDRFKPCIWDRGHGLGGILSNKAVREVFGDDRYFDRNIAPMLTEGSKVNLNNWPGKVTEHVRGVDKPVRDRYRASRDGIKDFIPEDTLRRFSHLFSVKVGEGTLIVCTFRLQAPEIPVVSNFLELLIDRTETLAADHSITPEELKAWLQQVNEAGFPPEGTTNQTWQNDHMPGEKVLFWEELNMDLAAIK